MKIKKILVCMLCLSLAGQLHAIELSDGVRQELGMPFSDDERNFLPLVSQAVRTVAPKSETGRSIAFLKIDDENWLRLYDNFTLYAVDVSVPSLSYFYNLKRWKYLESPRVIKNTSSNGDLKSTVNYSKYYSSLGCYNTSPLRIGDVEDDGISEVILFLNDEMIIFSPEYQRIVFAMFTDISDYFPYGEQALLEETYLKDHDTPPTDEVLFHDMAYSWVDSAFEGRFEPAIRVYTKVYAGDFDEDGNPDLVTWQKIYQAEPKTSTLPYKRLDNLLTHYERNIEAQAVSDIGVTGEYLPQITEQSVVSQWLTESGLTWQQGFPSHSECEGQEGELIPEMHDPLLNDPDVLK